jgi:hypothetical protein
MFHSPILATPPPPPPARHYSPTTPLPHSGTGGEERPLPRGPTDGPRLDSGGAGRTVHLPQSRSVSSTDVPRASLLLREKQPYLRVENDKADSSSGRRDCDTQQGSSSAPAAPTVLIYCPTTGARRGLCSIVVVALAIVSGRCEASALAGGGAGLQGC